ncbi:MAG: repeat variant [Microbacteriaceae bacterium]|nr:repeat variant [Microbacteriaceae bacterium]
MSEPIRNQKDARGLPTGEWEELFADGTRSAIVHYVGGVKHGESRYWYRNGQLKAIGSLDRGEFTGAWTWRENGRLLQQGEFRDGKQIGPWKRYHATGAIMDEGEWVDGIRSGEWKYYDSNGELLRTKRHRVING